MSAYDSTLNHLFALLPVCRAYSPGNRMARPTIILHVTPNAHFLPGYSAHNLSTRLHLRILTLQHIENST